MTQRASAPLTRSAARIDASVVCGRRHEAAVDQASRPRETTAATAGLVLRAAPPAWSEDGREGVNMARILVQGDDLVVRLPWWEKAAARRGNVRTPLAAVRRVTVEPAWWRALRGVVLHGVWIPGVLCVGTRGHPGGQDFVAVRPGRPVVCVELRPTAPFSLLAVSARDDAEVMAERLRRCTPDNDTSTPWRQPLPAAEETENSWRALTREPRRRRRRPRPASTARRGHAPKSLQVRAADRRPVHGR